MDKVLEVTLIFKSGASATFIAGEFKLRDGADCKNIWEWTNSPILGTTSLVEFEADNIDCVLTKEIEMPRRLS
jgi:hypothetical protein